MKGFIFRKAEAADMPELLRVAGEARRYIAAQGIDQWQDGYPGADVLEQDIALGQLYVFADGARLAAMAVLSLLPEPVYDGIEGAWRCAGPYLTIHRMAIDDAHRGGGLAAAIVARAEALARDAHLSSLRADTHEGNRAMNRFLQKQGFERCGLVYYHVKTGDPKRIAYEKRM